MKIPEVGLGTWMLRGKECVKAVRTALDLGYRHIDTAFAYENHQEVGEAIQGFDRESLFLTSKISLGQATKTYVHAHVNDTHIQDSVSKSCDLALKELKTDYLDLMLIHWPDRSHPLEAILAALHREVEKGKLRYAGVSNYTAHHLADAYQKGLSVAFNQVEFHPYLYQRELLEFARANGTELIAFRPFGKGKLLKEEPLFAKIGKAHGKTPAQVILRWILQKGIPSIPKASSKKHLEENINIFDFNLSSEEEKAIDGLSRNCRYCFPDWSEYDY